MSGVSNATARQGGAEARHAEDCACGRPHAACLAEWRELGFAHAANGCAARHPGETCTCPPATRPGAFPAKRERGAK